MSDQGALDDGAGCGPAILLIDEIKLLLEEKRGALMVMRTGVMIVLAQVAICGLMIAASRSYLMREVPHLSVPFLVVNALLLAFAFYLIAHSFGRIRHFDRVLRQLKTKDRLVGAFLDL